jgi:hypothetical protein
MQDPISPLAFGLALGAVVLLVDLVVTLALADLFRRCLERQAGADEEVDLALGVDWIGMAQTFAVAALSGAVLQGLLA